MKNIEKKIVYLSFLVLLIITFFPAMLEVLSNYKSSESFQLYSAIIIGIIIVVFISLSDMKKLRSIIIFLILNFSIFIIPASISFVYTRGNIDNSYVLYTLNYISEGSILSWLLPTVLLNSISTLLFILKYIIIKYNK